MTVFPTNVKKQKALKNHRSKLECLPVERCRAIVAEHIGMTFQNGNQSFEALRDVNLTVRGGEIHLLMGPSGSGKTTLLSILGGILKPTRGRVWLLDEEITRMASSKLAEFRLHNIGFIFQGFNLFPALTASENIRIVLKLKGYSASASRKEAADLLEQVGLGDKRKMLPQQLSGGQKQRVAIARALAGSPPLIMADEPTAALDSKNGAAVIHLLRTLAKDKGTTVLMVTHDPRIMDVADRIAYLEDGHLQESPPMLPSE
ncbi:MAG: ABC transporter ATP-binding protein [Synechococcales cyanobacterium T60_A2020_003]|nr:ABC transporter ATP-binding protein [Synechococcales cyanobacterium T60_A2020_003]